MRRGNRGGLFGWRDRPVQRRQPREGNGEIPQLEPHGVTQRQAWQTRLLAVGPGLYLALTVSPTAGDTEPFRIHLLKRSAN